MNDNNFSTPSEADVSASAPPATAPPAGQAGNGRRRDRYLPAFALIPGMVLAKPLVITERGIVTFSLPAGKMLTEALLRQLRAHHGEFACIENWDERPESQRQLEADQAQGRLAEIFRHADRDSPAAGALHDLILAYRRS
ncbi:MAG TPA: hypothetical protein VJ548_10240 [Azospira sp.]|nr:hypothetical protein [Azospira sp.]